MRKRWKWFVLLAVVAGFAALFLLGPAARTQVTFSAVMPLPAGNVTNIPFEVKGSRLFWMNGNSNFVEAITVHGTTNYEFIRRVDPGGRLPSTVFLRSLETVINVVIPEGTKQFRVKKGYWEPPAGVSASFSLSQRHPTLAKWALQISRPFQRPPEYREVWSPWLVKTNGMWVERAER